MLKLKKYRVLELMEIAGYRTQGDLADALGVSRTWVSHLLNGHTSPTTDQLVMLVRLLNATIDDIADYPKAPFRARVAA